MSNSSKNVSKTTEKLQDGRNSWLTYLDKKQLEVSFIALFAMGFAKFGPFKSTFGNNFFKVEGKLINEDNLYKPIFNDIYIIITSIFTIIFVRIFIMDYILRPIGHYVLTIPTNSSKQRFAEQGWATIQYSSSFLWGFKIFYYSSYFHNFDNLYANYPHYMSKEFKVYYLVELSAWIAQVFILNVEKRRKDHYEMFSHHIITILLVFGSYYQQLMRVGNVIMTIMDFVDIWLSLAKVLRYCGFSNLCDFTFLLFFFSWVFLRHGLYNYLVYFSYTRTKALLSPSLCGNNPDTINCLPPQAIDWLIILLCGLQCIMIIWMFMILRVLFKILTGSNAEDIRSDSEEEEEEEVDHKDENFKDEEKEEKVGEKKKKNSDVRSLKEKSL